jgi:hypothetical protein
MNFKPYDYVTQKAAQQVRGTVVGTRYGSPNPKRPDRVWVAWEGRPEDMPGHAPDDLQLIDHNVRP